jgi:transcriptional regulator with XRE-family HTH domain
VPNWRILCAKSSPDLPIRRVAPERRAFIWGAMLAERVGENITRARKARGWSLDKLAQKVSIEGKTPVRYSTISRLEKGKRGLTLEWVDRIAKALGVDPGELIQGAPPAAPRAFSLGEQVANEVAQTLAEAVLGDVPPEPGTVQVVALMLQELSATFAKNPQAFHDPRLARPVLDLAALRHGPATKRQ